MKMKTIISANNIWDRESFQMCGLGEKNKTMAKIKYFGKCVRWSWQRIVRGYADCDKWNMYRYLQKNTDFWVRNYRRQRNWRKIANAEAGEQCISWMNYRNIKKYRISIWQCRENWKNIEMYRRMRQWICLRHISLVCGISRVEGQLAKEFNSLIYTQGEI